MIDSTKSSTDFRHLWVGFLWKRNRKQIKTEPFPPAWSVRVVGPFRRCFRHWIGNVSNDPMSICPMNIPLLVVSRSSEVLIKISVLGIRIPRLMRSWWSYYHKKWCVGLHGIDESNGVVGNQVGKIVFIEVVTVLLFFAISGDRVIIISETSTSMKNRWLNFSLTWNFQPRHSSYPIPSEHALLLQDFSWAHTYSNIFQRRRSCIQVAVILRQWYLVQYYPARLGRSNCHRQYCSRPLCCADNGLIRLYFCSGSKLELKQKHLKRSHRLRRAIFGSFLAASSIEWKVTLCCLKF